MQTYQCPDCGDEVTPNDGHPCDPMAGLDETDRPRASNHDMTKDQRLDDPRHGQGGTT